MSSTRKESTSICNRVTYGINKVAESFYLKPGEPAILLIPIGIGVAFGGICALPSALSALFAHSLLPIYTATGLGVGSTVGVGGIVYSRLTNKQTEVETLDTQKSKDDYIALVKMRGEIDDKFSDTYIPVLTNAFKDSKAKGVVIKINSRGGLPAQSSIVYDEILKLKEKYHKKVVVVGEDYLASGAYYIAASADAIYVNASTRTGSIGVIANGYGINKLAEKWGIESRTYTAGAHKDRLNPLLPENKEDVADIQKSLDEMHQDFKDSVLKGRKDKLKGDPEKIFSGAAWTGKTALELGLVDAIGNFSDVMEKEFDVSNFKEYKQETSGYDFLSKLSKFVTKPRIELNLFLSSDQPQLKM